MGIGIIFKLIPTPGRIIALATFIIGMVYPTWNSFLAIESPDEADDKQWLTYWVVVCTLQLIERPLWIVLAWVPLYGVFKLILVAWLSHPQFKGATLVYDIVVRPFLLLAADKARSVPALAPFAERFLKSSVEELKASKPSKPAKAPKGAPVADLPPVSTEPLVTPVPEPEPASFLPVDIVEGSLAPKPHSL